MAVTVVRAPTATKPKASHAQRRPISACFNASSVIA
jgi:hypothetical protein